MSFVDLLWGIAVIAAGLFIGVYGNLLFRFALAAMGFGLGFLAGMWLFESQDETMRVLIAVALGGIGAIGFYSLVKFTLNIAGAMLGLVLSFVIIGIIDIFTSRPDGAVQTVLALAGTGAGLVFGRRIGNSVIILGSAATGAFLLMNGLHVLFESSLNTDLSEPASNLGTKLSLTIFAMMFALSALGQWNAQRFRQRVLS